MKADNFRKIALSLVGVIESSHMGHPDFRANGKIFATLSADLKYGMVKLTPDQQQGYLNEYSGSFEPVSGAWGRQGCTMVRLVAADKTVVQGALELAWRNIDKKSESKPSRTRKKRAQPASAAKSNQR